MGSQKNLNCSIENIILDKNKENKGILKSSESIKSDRKTDSDFDTKT